MKFLFTESQIKKVVEMTTNAKFLNEGKNENDALMILKKSGIDNVEEIFNYIKGIDKSKNNKLLPVLASFYVNNPSVPEREIISTFLKIYEEPTIPDITLDYKNKEVKFLNHKFNINEFDEFKSFIDHYFYKDNFEDDTEKKLIDVNANMILNTDKFTVYEAPSPNVCIKLFGSDNKNRLYPQRSYCIGAGTEASPNSNYHSHRDPEGAWGITFYVVVDKIKLNHYKITGEDDSSLINVVGVRYENGKIKYFVWDKNNRGSGEFVAGYESVNDYIKDLKNSGLDIKIFKPKEYINLNDNEIDRVALDTSGNLFFRLTPKQKYRYLMRKAKILTPLQMEFVIERMPSEVIINFLKSPIIGNLPLNSYDKLNNNLKKTYLKTKLLQLYTGSPDFHFKEFAQYLKDNNIRNYVIQDILKTLDPNSDIPLVNEEMVSNILSSLSPEHFLNSLKDKEKIIIDENNYNFGKLPENIGEFLNSVKKLTFRNIDIEAIPGSIDLANNLEELYINSCEKIKTLPESFGKLKNLKILEILNCQDFNYLPDSIGQLSDLTNLLINNCNITTIPTSVNNLGNLQVLNLKNNDLKTLPFESILNLSENQSLSLFVIKGNPTLKLNAKWFAAMKSSMILGLD